MNLDDSLTYVTPVFNGGKYIREVIESVSQQRSSIGLHYRHILVNDGSTDDSLEVITEALSTFPDHLLLISQENAGEATAVNRGVALVETPFFCVVNADDPLLPGHGETLTQVLTESPHVVVVYPDWLMLDSEGQVLRTVYTKRYDLRSLVGDFVCLPGPGAVIRREAVTGPLRDPSFRYISDFESWLRLSVRGPFKRVPQILATWRQHEAGATSTGAGRAIADELLQLSSQGLPTIFSDDILKDLERSAHSHALYYAALHLNRAGLKGARAMMIKSLLLKPFPSSGYETNHRHVLGVISVLLGPVGSRALHHLGRVRRVLRSRNRKE